MVRSVSSHALHPDSLSIEARREAASVIVAARRLPGLDGVRGLAIALVLGCHASVWFMPGGNIGVDIFFVLSGFLITRVISTEFYREGRIDFLTFYWHRFLRIVPPLLVMCTILLLLAPLFQIHRFELLKDAVIALTFVSDYTRAQTGIPIYFAQTWSLSVEEQFYLIWPFAALVLMTFIVPRRRIALILFGIAVFVGLWRLCRFHAATNVMAVYDSFDARCDALCYGSALAFLDARRMRLIGRLWPVALIILAWLVVCSEWRQPWMYAGGFTLVGLSSGIIVAAAAGASSPVLSFVLDSAIARSLGRISYSLYLWHWPPLIIMGSHGVQGPRLLWSIPVGVALSTLSTRYVEGPVARLRDFGSRRVRLAASVSVPTLLAAGLMVVVPNLPRPLSSEAIYADNFRDAVALIPGTVVRQSFHTNAGDVEQLSVSVVTWAKEPSPYTVHWLLRRQATGSVLAEGSFPTQGIFDWEVLTVPVQPTSRERDFELTFFADPNAVGVINPVGLPLFKAIRNGEAPAAIDANPRSDGAVIGLRTASRPS